MPRVSRIAAREAAAMPFPREETTPPVTNTYFVMDAYDTGKGLPEQIDREGNTGFMQKIGALTLPLSPMSATVSGNEETFIQLSVHSTHPPSF